MIRNENLVVGGIYKTIYDERPKRIIGFDSVELFYDGWWTHPNSWGLKSHNGKVFFYRASVKEFKENAELIDVDPLDDDETAKYQLDLPFRICRNLDISWTSTFHNSINEFMDIIERAKSWADNSKLLKTKRIKLYPFGPKGGFKKSVAIDADNGEFFTETELLWKAHNIQASYIKETKQGVGLFRLGLEKSLSSYYIGHYYGDAEILKDEL